MMKRLLTFVSDVQKSVLLDFISQNFALSQNLSKLSSSKLIKIVFILISAKMKKLIFLLYFFEFLCAVLFDYFQIVAIVKVHAVVEKKTALITHEIVIVIIGN